MDNVTMQQVEAETEKRGFAKFRDLIEEIDQLSEEKQRQVALFTQGFLAGANCGK